MAHANKVIRSINLVGDGRCVDVFQRPDGSFGFEEFRRDPEDGRGWFPVGHHSGDVFAGYEAALGEARRRVVWLDEAIEA